MDQTVTITVEEYLKLVNKAEELDNLNNGLYEAKILLEQELNNAKNQRRYSDRFISTVPASA